MLEDIANQKDKTEAQKILYLPRSFVPSLMRIFGLSFIFGSPFSLRFKQSDIFHGSVDSKTIKTSDICSISPLSVVRTFDACLPLIGPNVTMRSLLRSD